MSDKDETSRKPKKHVVSSETKDPRKAQEYWTKEQMEKAKPIPFPTNHEADSEDSENQDDEP